MKTIKILQCQSTGFDHEFSSISSVQIDLNPFAEGGFGRIYHCNKINNVKPTNPQVIKIFKDNGQGSAAHSYKTIRNLQSKFVEKIKELDDLGIRFLDYYPAFFGAPQFVFEGELDGEEVQGYAANNLISFGYTSFSDVLNSAENREKYLSALRACARSRESRPEPADPRRRAA